LGKLAAHGCSEVDLRRAVTLLLVCFLVGSVRAAEVVPWLYEVSVPVTGQSVEERQQAASAALLQLLTRLSGLAHVPRTPEVIEALGEVDRYYNEFRFAAAEEDGLELVVQFASSPVQELIRTAGLPVWRASRERVLVWVVIQEGGQRSLVGATSPSPLVTGFEQQAVARGLPLTMPLLDLEDQLAVDPAAVWGRLSQVIDPASLRYGADVLLLGRIAATAEGVWQGEWEFWLDGVVVPFVATGPDLEVQAMEAVDILADELAARRVVHGRQAGRLRLAVGGVTTPTDYGALLGYIRSMEFIEQVGVLGLSNSRLWLTIDTPADPDQLLAIFERDGHLFNDQLMVLNSADLRLIWRSSD